MDTDSPDEILSEFRERRLGFWGVLQVTAGTGLAVYGVWAGILMPGFRKVPLKLQVLNSSIHAALTLKVMSIYCIVT